MFCHIEAIKCEWAPFTALLYLISGPKYSQKSHIFFCWKVAERNFRNPLLAKFDFYVLSSGGHKKWVSAVYRTTLSHKWTEIFTKIAYFLLLESSRTKFQKPFVCKVWFLCSVIWRPQKWVSAVYRTTLSHKWTEIFTKIAYFLLLESSRTKFQKPFVSKVWFLCSVISRPQNVSEHHLPHYSIS